MRITDTSDLWWKTAVVYCLDVETFLDSDDDGTGDFAGAAQRLDYLEALGVTCLWLMPFYPTPDRDDGYDIVDFYGVDRRLGHLGDQRAGSVGRPQLCAGLAGWNRESSCCLRLLRRRASSSQICCSRAARSTSRALTVEWTPSNVNVGLQALIACSTAVSSWKSPAIVNWVRSADIFVPLPLGSAEPRLLEVDAFYDRSVRDGKGFFARRTGWCSPCAAAGVLPAPIGYLDDKVVVMKRASG